MTPDDVAKLPYRPCVGVMLVNREGHTWVGQRIDSPQDSPAWQMPQGGVDPGEKPRDAALRELTEETGVKPGQVSIIAETSDWIPYDLPVDLVPKLWKGRYRGQSQKWFLMRFDGADSDINIVTEEPEFSHWRWLAPDAVLDQIVPFKREVYRQVIDAFREHL